MSSPTDADAERILHGRNLADDIKSRATLVGLVGPLAIAGGLAQHPVQNLRVVGGIASELLHGNFSQAGADLGSFASAATRPGGVAGVVYQSGLYLQAGVDALVGGVELYQGVRNKDRWLGMMGGADLLSSGSSLAFALSGTGPALGLGLCAAAAKVALVLARPQEYSRIQKTKVVFDACGAVCSTLLKAGVATVPALIGNAVFGPTQMLYMNNKAFRGKVDAAIDWVLRHVTHR